jgi:hypothetical protein
MLGLAQQFWQLGDVGGDAPGFVLVSRSLAFGFAVLIKINAKVRRAIIRNRRGRVRAGGPGRTSQWGAMLRQKTRTSDSRWPIAGARYRATVISVAVHPAVAPGGVTASALAWDL